jgi:phosphotransferase system, enzyme I, PtsP
MSPAAVGPVKAMILDLDASAVAEVIDAELARSTSQPSLRPALAAFAEARGVTL